MPKTIFILIDGLGYRQAVQNLGFLEHLIEQGLGLKAKVLSELPSSSRPLYETLHTGLPAAKHGIACNLTVRMSKFQSVFELCRENGLTTAASAYYWISELYTRAPFQHTDDRIRLMHDGAINHGIYYFEDSYPDSHVFSDAEYLRGSFDPDFLLVHSMNVDDAGHKEGCNSLIYYSTIAKLNVVLSTIMPLWLKWGYNILVTSDHGMSEYGLHGGNTQEQRIVPLYIFSDQVKKKAGLISEEPLPQLFIAPIFCRLLAIRKSGDMKDICELGVDMFEKV
jgi:predicted AlkP superfamily pyrophosphatase or phosphodiesterase